MDSHSTADDNKSNKTVADDLYRIHCYASTLAQLCKYGSSQDAIEPKYLEQIFNDIATVTDDAAARLYTNADPLTET